MGNTSEPYTFLDSDKYPAEIEYCADIISSFFTYNPHKLTKKDFEIRWKIAENRKVTLVTKCWCGQKVRWKGNCAGTDMSCKTLTCSGSIKRWGIIVSICPEVLADLPTPREACEGPINGKVFSATGIDYTELFNLGAQKVLQNAFSCGAKEFIGKAGSPSCGVGMIYDGTFTGTMIPGDGVTTALLKEYGLKVSCM
jgi:uncharacterized protein YbbK (DUF523 family)